ncbi:MAG: MGMT family protein [Candidatus Omnitrophota bacterium]
MKKERRRSKGVKKSELFDGCTEFEVCVYKCIMKIPSGETRTYAWVAEKIGKPKATRAVAQALHRNPWPLFIPCHRVIESNGKIGGYAYGIELKRLFLSMEKKGATFYVGADLLPKRK